MWDSEVGLAFNINHFDQNIVHTVVQTDNEKANSFCKMLRHVSSNDTNARH